MLLCDDDELVVEEDEADVTFASEKADSTIEFEFCFSKGKSFEFPFEIMFEFE